MTDPEKRIEALVQTPPKVVKTHRQKVVTGFALFFALVATVAFALSVVGIYGTAQVAACTNSNLGTRSQPTANDAKAHIAFAQAVQALFLPPNASKEQQIIAVDGFRGATVTYVSQLEADQAARNAHPLGKC